MTSIDRDFGDLAVMRVPVKRAAYSRRTAWTMAILAELAYTPFDEESEQHILDLAEELATLTDREKIADRLVKFRKTLGGLDGAPEAERRNQKLRAALACGGFQLVGSVLYDPGTDTQGFVAVRRDDEGTGMAVICFRGTTRIRDWMTNLDIAPQSIENPRTGAPIGNMHKGFHNAYRSVHGQIGERLKGLEDLPLYITGHSLGGALAVVATWYQSSQRLAACYTFGAPRVGDQGLIDRFKTPIYRIVNGPDPVSLVPPAGFGLEIVKAVFRVLGVFLPFWGWAAWVTDKLIRNQRFRHYGYMRYLTVAKPGPDGSYPALRLEFALSTLDRLARFIRLRTSGTGDRIDKYHDIARYRNKLRAHALRANRS
ncbi:MAG: lipase family protein [Gemmatimonadetes bacterium]|nr:lipase family protein [Gemmatimonadota bacterium]